MLHDSHAFSSFSVNDPNRAKQFYGETLGLAVEEIHEGLQLHLAGGGEVFLYAKPDHQPATFTVLNFLVKDIDKAVEALQSKGVTFEHYDGTGGAPLTDDKSIARGLAAKRGPDIAWFKDPAGNVLSVLQTD